MISIFFRSLDFTRFPDSRWYSLRLQWAVQGQDKSRNSCVPASTTNGAAVRSGMSAENPSEMVFKRSLGNKEPKENRGRWHRSNCIDGSGSCWKYLWREIMFVCSYAEKLALILTGEENRTDRQQQETQSQVRKTEKNGCFESFTSRWWQSEQPEPSCCFS